VGGTPQSYVLSVSNYPNPFNPRTTVNYTVPSRGMVDIDVYDANGARVATLFHGERNVGAYSVEWDGKTKNAAVAASGLYFARISHDGTTRTKKMVLLK
jgi:flagellar hook assembly protein FlgD